MSNERAHRARWARYYTDAVPDVVTARQLEHRLEGKRREFGGTERHLRRLVQTGVPRCDLAWAIGQELRPEIRYSCGPVGLWLAGHYTDLIGVVAMAKKLGLYQIDPLVEFVQLESLRFISVETIFEERPHFLHTYRDMVRAQGASSDDFYKLKSAMRPLISNEDEIILQRSEDARRRWTISLEDVAGLDLIWGPWHEVKAANKAAVLCSEVGKAFYLAYLVAESKDVGIEEKERLIVHNLASAPAEIIRDYARSVESAPESSRSDDIQL